MNTRRLVRKVFARFGFSIDRRPLGVGADPFADMVSLSKTDRPVIFDVGANIGQSITWFRSYFKNAEMHSFEPSPTTFSQLQRNAPRDGRVRLWNCALGSRNAELEFLENTLPECSSFLPPGPSAWGSVARKTVVPVHTLDDFCAHHNIEKIDILKTDTQGYEIEVFRGCDEMFRSGAVGLIFCEMLFANQYEGAPSFGQLYDFLVSKGFLLVSFYDISYEKGLAAWTDGLFIHESRVSSILQAQGCPKTGSFLKVCGEN
jgi:FkbM family methyltransferase